MRKDLPLWLWLYVPLSIWALSFFKLISRPIKRLITGEDGIIENLTVVLLIIAVYIGIRLYPHVKKLPWKWFGWWIIIMTLGCFYFGGEEWSWGQKLFHWGTPEAWTEINIQDETNLHNLDAGFGLFNKIPRLILTVLAFAVGIVYPIIRKFKKIEFNPDNFWYWLVPTYVCIPACFFAVFAHVPGKIAENLDWHDAPKVLFVHSSEGKECFMALFLLFYLWSIYSRIKNSELK